MFQVGGGLTRNRQILVKIGENVGIGRSVSEFSPVIRRLETYLRSTIVQDRCTSLALLHIRRDFELNLNAIINTFATKHHRRMKLVNILDSDKLSE